MWRQLRQADSRPIVNFTLHKGLMSQLKLGNKHDWCRGKRSRIPLHYPWRVLLLKGQVNTPYGVLLMHVGSTENPRYWKGGWLISESMLWEHNHCGETASVGSGLLSELSPMYTYKQPKPIGLMPNPSLSLSPGFIYHVSLSCRSPKKNLNQ